jgi:hypothetical protein
MKNLMRSVFVAAAALLVAPPSASASTYQSFHCQCTAPEGESCSCSYSYTLGKLATKEFRGYCDEMADGTKFPDLFVHNLNKGNTCTIQVGVIATPQYRSRSCTNWSLTRSDSVDIEIDCHNVVDGGGVGP